MDIKTLKEKLKPEIEKTGYLLYDVEIYKEFGKTILRIAIDLDDREINVDDCSIVTEKINDYIDVLDPIKDEYYLEVSSPGAERELRSEKDFVRYEGSYVHVETYEQKLEGTLFKNFKDSIILQIRGKNITIDKLDIQFIRLAIKF